MSSVISCLSLVSPSSLTFSSVCTVCVSCVCEARGRGLCILLMESETMLRLANKSILPSIPQKNLLWLLEVWAEGVQSPCVSFRDDRSVRVLVRKRESERKKESAGWRQSTDLSKRCKEVWKGQSLNYDHTICSNPWLTLEVDCWKSFFASFNHISNNS